MFESSFIQVPEMWTQSHGLTKLVSLPFTLSVLLCKRCNMTGRSLLGKLDIVARGPGIVSPPARRRPHPLSKGYLRMEFGQNRLVSKNFKSSGIVNKIFPSFLGCLTAFSRNLSILMWDVKRATLE
jgi:hypothetical protein